MSLTPIKVYLELNKDDENILETLELSFVETITVADMIKNIIDNFNESFKTNGKKIKLSTSEKYKLCQYSEKSHNPSIRSTKKLREIGYTNFRLLYNESDIMFGFTEDKGYCFSSCNII